MVTQVATTNSVPTSNVMAGCPEEANMAVIVSRSATAAGAILDVERRAQLSADRLDLGLDPFKCVGRIVDHRTSQYQEDKQRFRHDAPRRLRLLDELLFTKC